MKGTITGSLNCIVKLLKTTLLLDFSSIYLRCSNRTKICDVNNRISLPLYSGPMDKNRSKKPVSMQKRFAYLWTQVRRRKKYPGVECFFCDEMTVFGEEPTMTIDVSVFRWIKYLICVLKNAIQYNSVCERAVDKPKTCSFIFQIKSLRDE